MFDTLERQYLNKLVEGKIGDLTSPETFHRIKVECLGGDEIEPLTQVGRCFPVPIQSLVGDFAMKPCEFTDSAPVVTRTFDLSADGFAKFTEFGQGVFQGLRVLDFLTGVECQIRLHAEVYPYAFTCSGQDFFGGVICNDIKPQCSDSVATDLDIADISFPLAMLVKQEETFIVFVELLGVRIPLPKRNANTPAFKFISIRKLRRTVFLALFELRGPDTSATSTFFDPIKESLITDMDTDDHRVQRITGYPCPVLLGALEQIRQMRLQTVPAGVFPIDTVISLFQFQEVVMDIAEVIEHIAQAFVFRMFTQLILVHTTLAFLFSLFHGFHVSRFYPLTSGRQARSLATTLVMPANVI